MQNGTISRRTALCAAFVATALIGTSFTPVWAAPEVSELDFWAVRDAQESAALAVASKLGYFEEEGLNLNIKWIVTGTDTASLVASGQIAMTGESAVITAMLRDKNIDIRYVMPTSNIAGAQMFILGPNTEVSSPKDLEGMKVGMAAGSGVNIAIASMCEDQKIDCSQINFVNLQPPDQLPALIRGDIDAMAIWQPYALAGINAGGKVYFTGNTSYITGEAQPVDYMYLDGGIMVHGDYMDKNPETVKAVMRAHIKATNYINSTPVEEVAKLISSSLEIPEADLAQIMKGNIYTNVIDDATVAGVTKLMAYAGRSDIGWTSKPFLPTDVYDLSLLKEIAPELITASGL